MIACLSHAVRVLSAFAAVAVLVHPICLLADAVVLNDGKIIEGEVADRGETYDVKTRFGMLAIRKEEVKKVVREPAQALASAEALQKHARQTYDEAMKLSDEKERLRKWNSGLEFLEQALKICRETREFFPGPAHERLDQAASGILAEINRFRQKMPADPSKAGPAAPAPVVNPKLTPPAELAPPIRPPAPAISPAPGPVSSRPPPPAPAVQPKLLPPAAKAQQQAESLIRDVFKTEYVKRTPADLTALAKRLIQQGVETKDDPAACFVLFREARDLAIQAGDAGIALMAVESMARFFTVDLLSEKLDALSKAEGTAKTPDAVRALTDLYLRLVDEAESADQYEMALRIGTRVESIVRAAGDPALASRVHDRVKATRDLQQQAVALAPHQKSIETHPDDPAANAALGKFVCLTKGDWNRGLPMLAKGSDPDLKALAVKELARSVEPADQIALADAWWEAGEKQSGTSKVSYFERALYWYGAAAPKASGLTRAKIDARMAAFDKLFPRVTALAGQEQLQGFGTSTRGGAGQPVVHVKTLADRGPDCLRTALSKGNRTIVFDVAGEIVPTYGLLVDQPFITIDGSSAPPPGVTIKGGLNVRGDDAHDIVIRGVRFRDGGLGIGRGAHHVVVDHVSVHGSRGAGLSIGGEAHDVTVCWSIFSGAGLYSSPGEVNDCYRITLHHNLFAKGPRTVVNLAGEYLPRGTARTRPKAGGTETSVDFRNNLVWGWPAAGSGLRVIHDARVNVVGNFFGSGGGNKDHAAIGHVAAKIFAAMNGSIDPAAKNPDGIGEEKALLPAAPVKTSNASTAARDILSGAGARPLDATDDELFRAIGLRR